MSDQLPVNQPELAGQDNNVLTAGKILGIKLKSNTSKIAWQVGKIQNIWYRAYGPDNSTDKSAKIIPRLQNKPSIISLTYLDLDLIPPGQPNKPFSPSQLKLAHSLDGIKWTILSNSVVDSVNKTVVAIDKIGGYYMIVAETQSAIYSPKTLASKKTLVKENDNIKPKKILRGLLIGSTK